MCSIKLDGGKFVFKWAILIFVDFYYLALGLCPMCNTQIHFLFPFFFFLYSMFIFPFLHPFSPASQLIQSNGFESSNQISPDNMAMNSGKKPKLCSSIKGFKLPLKMFAMT